MLDVAPTELLLVAVIALLIIGPKDLPKAMRFVGTWVGKARGVARQFRSGFDTMVREAELAELEKQWATENERIMREHPPSPALPSPDGTQPVPQGARTQDDAEPVMVEQPAFRDAAPVPVEPAPVAATPPAGTPPEDTAGPRTAPPQQDDPLL